MLKRYTQKIVLILLITICFFSVVGICQFNKLTVTESALTATKITQPIRVLQLTDLHNAEFGENNANLIAECTTQEPDLILMTGDLINMNEEDTSVAEDLIVDLTYIAPVYVSLGNHEIQHQQNFGSDLIIAFEEAGATVLEREYEDVLINGQTIRLGGIYGYCLPAKFLKTNEADPEECAFLSEFQDTENYTILMCHMPVCWMINEGLDEWDIDCVFAGHAHGGQIIIPFVGGVIAPDMGFFPGKLEGVFSSKDDSKHLVLSRGLGSGTWVPRINNKPEIVMVEITPAQEVK